MTTAPRPSAAIDDAVVELVDAYPRAWASRFAAVHARVRQLLGPDVLIEHIGSTAVPGLPAKDVVDALVGVQRSMVDPAAQSLASAGFVVEGRRDGHVWLSQRRDGRRDCIVHVVEVHSRWWERRIAFRDLLRRDLDARAEYTAVKRAAADGGATWDAYGTAKAETVRRLLARAETSEHSCTREPCGGAPEIAPRARVSPDSPWPG